MVIVHDFFSQNGGGENLVLSLAKELDIKILTTYNLKKKQKFIKQSKLHFILKYSKLSVFFFYKLIFRVKSKGTIIFSGNHCCFSISNCKAKRKILYAHSLPKSLFPELYMDHKRSVFSFFFKKMQIEMYRKNLYCLDKIFFNSNKTKLKFLNKFKDLDKKVDCEVLYPFSDLEFKTEKLMTNKVEKYFVINSRHQHYKNINHILMLVNQFLESNKDIKIYITQEGKLTENLTLSHSQSKQIRFTGYLDFKDYQSLLFNSIGIIFTSRDEDFGIAALDAYNLNIPVIVQKNCGFSEVLTDDYLYFYNDKNLKLIMSKLIKESNNENFFYKNKLNYKKIFLEKIKQYV